MPATQTTTNSQPSNLPLTLDSRSKSLALELAELWRPPIRSTLSKWSEENIRLSAEYSAKTSKITLYGWQREIFDAFTDPYVREIVLMCGTQLTKTLFIQCAIAYIVKEDQGPILLVMPKEEDAKEFSKERLAPMIRDNDCFKTLISESNHDGSNTILSKGFPGGRLSLVSSMVPGNMARRSIRYGFFDEVDKYPKSAGKEGDSISLARKRLVTFKTRAKAILTCSPTVAGESRIAIAYEASDQRKPWVPCPVCRSYQLLKWPGVKFDTSLPREKVPDSAYYLCANPNCNHHWSDIDRKRACEEAQWRASKPFNKVAGFWISGLYSPHESLSGIVDEFLKAKDNPNEFMVFVNTVLAELWEQKGETPDAEILEARAEDYPHSGEAVVPQQGLFLTAFTDVQGSPPRLECEVKAWGRNRESWSVGYFVIQVFADNGEPLPVTSQELWDELDRQVLKRDWLHASGNTMPIRAMMVDTGYNPRPVYDFARRHPRVTSGPVAKIVTNRTVIPTKGNDDSLQVISRFSGDDAGQKRKGVRIVFIGTHRAKQEVYDNLRNIDPRKRLGEPKPGCFHHPKYTRKYFEGLCGEYRVVEQKTNKVKWVKKTDTRNEPLDLAVGNLAAAYLCGIDRMSEEYWVALENSLAPLPVEDLTEEVPGDSDDLDDLESTGVVIPSLFTETPVTQVPVTQVAPVTPMVQAQPITKPQPPPITRPVQPASTPRPPTRPPTRGVRNLSFVKF